MQVTEAEGRLFYELFVGLQLFVNRRHRILDGCGSFEDFMALPIEQRAKCRDAVYEHPEHFDEFLREGDLPASSDAADIVAGWRDHRVTGTFYVLRHLKRHTIFLSSEDPAKAYGVLGLADPIDVVIPYPPAMVDAVLLPFRGRIIYDGLLTTSGPALLFGGGIRRMFDDTYREAKARFGIITSLPHAVETTGEARHDDEARRLKVMLKSERSRRIHCDEILDLCDKSPELELVYHQERGKADARRIGRRLRDAGIAEGWFALFEGMVIASAPDRQSLISRVAEILPASKASMPYLYRLKKKRQ